MFLVYIKNELGERGRPLEQFLDSLGSEDMHGHYHEQMALTDWPAGCMVSTCIREFNDDGLCV